MFYRGSWCPYCVTQLPELASIENDLKKRVPDYRYQP